jgi:hypothetical protein
MKGYIGFNAFFGLPGPGIRQSFLQMLIYPGNILVGALKRSLLGYPHFEELPYFQQVGEIGFFYGGIQRFIAGCAYNRCADALLNTYISRIDQQLYRFTYGGSAYAELLH